MADGKPSDLKILASTDSEIDEQLQTIADAAGVPRSFLTVDTPIEWPITGLFID
jgi:hypothetical protein